MSIRVTYVLPATSLHGGNRVPFEHAEGLQERGYDVLVVSPDPPPDWHPVRVPYRQSPVFETGGVPAANICIGTFWPTVEPAFQSGSDHVFHLCQGYEGTHREYAPILDQIESAYRLPIPKLLISQHLEPILDRHHPEARTHLLGQAIDSSLFVPATTVSSGQRLRVGLVGTYGYRSKGIRDALEGLQLCRRAGIDLEVFRASSEPLSDEERDLGVTDHYYHRLSTGEMVGFYQQLDLFVHASHDEEGFPLPPLEAMACGVPAVLTRIGSFNVIPAAAAVRFDAGDPESLVPAIQEVTDADRRSELRHAGLECARGYQLNAVLDRMEAALEQEGAPTLGSRSSSGRAGLRREALLAEDAADPAELRSAYQGADPFPHIVLDELFSPTVLDRVLAEFPAPDQPFMRTFVSPTENKIGFDHRTPIGQDLAAFLNFLNSAPMLEYLEQLTGIEGLIPDPYFGGAGPHQSPRGGFLKIHADFNWHPKLELHRRLNLLVYLNRDWRDEYGGQLELWNAEMTDCRQRILPVFNRTVVFSTTDTSFHGHPHPMECPEGEMRRSISMYYYTSSRPAEEQSAPHDTVFRETPDHESA